MIIMVMYVGLFITLGWLMWLQLHLNWVLDDRVWLRGVLIVTGISFYAFLCWVIFMFVTDPVVNSLR